MTIERQWRRPRPGLLAGIGCPGIRPRRSSGPGLVFGTVFPGISVLPRIDGPVGAAGLPVPGAPVPVGLGWLVAGIVVARGTGRCSSRARRPRRRASVVAGSLSGPPRGRSIIGRVATVAARTPARSGRARGAFSIPRLAGGPGSSRVRSPGFARRWGFRMSALGAIPHPRPVGSAADPPGQQHLVGRLDRKESRQRLRATCVGMVLLGKPTVGSPDLHVAGARRKPQRAPRIQAHRRATPVPLMGPAPPPGPGRRTRPSRCPGCRSDREWQVGDSGPVRGARAHPGARPAPGSPP